MIDRKIQDNIKIQYLTDEYLDKAVKLIYDSFVKMNPLWKTIPSTFEEMKFPLTRRLSMSISKRLSYIALANDEVVCITSHIQPKDYILIREEEDKENLPELLDFLISFQNQYAQLLNKEQNLGQCVISLYGAVDWRFKSQSIFFDLIARNLMEFRQRRINYIYAFISNPRMFEISKPYLEDYIEIDISSKKYPQLNRCKFYFIKQKTFQVKKKPSL